MILQDWLKNGWLIKHQSSPAEISELLALVERDLSDCRIQDLSADWRLNIAYNVGSSGGDSSIGRQWLPELLRGSHH